MKVERSGDEVEVTISRGTFEGLWIFSFLLAVFVIGVLMVLPGILANNGCVVGAFTVVMLDQVGFFAGGLYLLMRSNDSLGARIAVLEARHKEAVSKLGKPPA